MASAAIAAADGSFDELAVRPEAPHCRRALVGAGRRRRVPWEGFNVK